MSSSAVEQPGAIFADASAYADPAAWHATAKRIREESPLLTVTLPDYPEFWAITKHADVMEIERHPDVFTNAPLPTLTPKTNVAAAAEAPVKTLIQMDGDEHKAHRGVVNDLVSRSVEVADLIWRRPRRERRTVRRPRSTADPGLRIGLGLRGSRRGTRRRPDQRGRGTH